LRMEIGAEGLATRANLSDGLELSLGQHHCAI